MKGKLRFSIKQERLNMLALMSVERKLLGRPSLDYTDMIETFTLAKAPKSAIDFISVEVDIVASDNNICSGHITVFCFCERFRQFLLHL